MSSPLKFATAMIALIGWTTPVQAIDAGAYLAAEVAASQSDFSAADGWYIRALQSDPDNINLLEGAMISALSLGDIARAAESAARLQKLGEGSQNIALTLLANRALMADFAGILADQSAGATVGSLMDDLAAAWANVGLGNMSDAIALFDKILATNGLQAFGLYHKAMALAQAGDFGGADNILSGRAAGNFGLTQRGAIMHAKILSQLEQNDEAIAILEQGIFAANDPEVASLIADLRAGETLSLTRLRDAKDGLAEAFFTVAAALNGETDEAYTLLHARIAVALRPNDADAILLTAALLEELDQHDLATQVYETIAPGDPAYTNAEIGRAGASFAAGRDADALAILQNLSRNYPDDVDVLIALGNGQRRLDDFAAAITTYDLVISKFQTPNRGQWAVFFSRGIAHEQMGNFDLAEQDMRRALQLNPDQPEVLNYLGYSLVDRGQKLDEALDMIKRAVVRRPDSGYIIDSLAWAYFRLGRYRDALDPMERASLLEPVDPIITDHLGDVYWVNGRLREAEFQWHRALSYSPTEKDAQRIRLKLEIGLDAVLESEGAAPLGQIGQ